MQELVDFIAESNRIEGINRPPRQLEIEEAMRFWCLNEVTIADLYQFVKVYQPDAQLRDVSGLNVMVGTYIPPAGGPAVGYRLCEIINDANRFRYENRIDRAREAFKIHVAYEKLHPFTDGNGRSGRMLWLWMMRAAPLGFLQTFYFQSLSAA